MASIVEQLQSDCLDPNVRSVDLLRKVKLVATKLQLADTLEWVELEQAGYNTKEEIPRYRIVRGVARWWNPMLGWRPVVFEDDSVSSRACIQTIGNPLSQIEEMAHKSTEDGALTMQTPEWLMKAASVNIEELVDVRIFVDRSEMQRIVQAVRDRILDWALELERQGIMGDGLTFSREEAAKAKTSQIVYNIGSIGSLGVVGDEPVPIFRTCDYTAIGSCDSYRSGLR